MAPLDLGEVVRLYGACFSGVCLPINALNSADEYSG